uniref:Uncharacterized protein n=1 Tax=Anopheles funestus TaxID=62324 RepID=A0A182RZX8_ANOFN
MNTTAIHRLIDCLERNLKILNQLGETTDKWGITLTQIIISKLDESMQHKWERHVEESGEKSVEDLLRFLRTQTRIMDAFAVDGPLTAVNRVSEIQDLTKGYKWRHVNGIDNPADIVSTGAMPNDHSYGFMGHHGYSSQKIC